jgi:O-antigen/teichoic acid export membrane protein
MLKLKSSVESLVKTSFTLVFILSFIISIISYTYNKEIMTLLYHQHIEISARIFSILMFCFIPISTTYIFGTLLTANGNLKELNIIASCGMVLNITLNFIFIPKFQVVGAAFSSLITQLLSASIQVFLAKKVFHLRYNIKFLRSLFLFILFVIFISNISRYLPYTWIIQIFIIGFFSVIIVFLLKLLKIKDLFLLFDKK